MSKQKQIAKAKARNEGMPEMPPKAEAKPTPQPVPKVDPQAEARAYVESLIKGERKPTNRYVADTVDQLRRGNQELQAVRNAIQDLTAQLEQSRTRLAALMGITQQLGLTLVKWREDGDAKEAQA